MKAYIVKCNKCKEVQQTFSRKIIICTHCGENIIVPKQMVKVVWA